MCRVQCSVCPHAGASCSYSSSKRLRDTHSQGLLMSRRQCIMYTCSMRSCDRATTAHHAGLSRPRASGLASFATITGRNQKLHGLHARRTYRQPRIRIAVPRRMARDGVRGRSTDWKLVSNRQAMADIETHIYDVSYQYLLACKRTDHDTTAPYTES